ncbi:DUF262 domain-containing protein [Nitrosophilus labii]|uniref:DUF262 domain-containing protein n=1 Tax=Nitrosophilus labii TaxID=2706014 RepID=UPI00165746C1|nr:DUF262 domain-containing protein [Nitrosophilus labii]
MANWTSLKIVDCIEKIEKEELVLPVVQRDFVWPSEKIELLFDTLLKGDSFGGIMTIKDLKGKKPIFSYRSFIKNYVKGNNVLSKEVEKLKQNISYVIDGQQRLSAFYIGILGTYNNKRLYFDLLSEIQHKHFNFKFAQNETSKELKPELDNYDGTTKNRTFWYAISDLYKKVEECGADYHTVYEDVIDENQEYTFNEKELELIKRNIENFTNQIFNFQNIGICEVRLDKKYDEVANRIRVVELFRRLNQGGTKLDALELMASKLKGYNPNHEKFLQEIETFNDIGFGKDEVIRLIFILQDDHKKTVVNITKEDSDFIEKYQDRIKSALKGTKLFLEQSNLYKFYKDEKPSIIPLYFIAYFLFHLEKSNKEIEEYFNNSEINNKNFSLIYKWVYLSMLNKVFRRRGAGWTAYSTGIRKILSVLSKNKNKDFPTDELFEMYYNHPLDFDENIEQEYLDDYDFDFLMYIIYEKPKTFRKNDIDHIYPKSILEKKGYEWSKINSIVNYQLLDFSTNRGNKKDKELYEWIKNNISNKNNYLKMHLIPDDEDLWESDNFDGFLEERGKLITNKLKKELT